MLAEPAAGRAPASMHRLPTIGIVLMLLLLAASLFVNLSYPLMWADESETAMFGSRILTYGYPKIHEDMKTVFCYSWPDTSLAIDQAHDAYVPTTWGHFYVAAAGVLASRLTADIYLKTFLVRLPFALIGFCGIILFLYLLRVILPRGIAGNRKFLILFLALEVLSISLVLHLREVRYYSLLVFLCALLLLVQYRYRFLKTISWRRYVIVATVLLVLVFNVFYPAYFIIGIVVVLYEAIAWVWGRVTLLSRTLIQTAPSTSYSMKTVVPVLVSGVLLLPLFSYHRVFQIQQQFSSAMAVYPGTYWQRIVAIVSFFHTYEFLDVMLLLQALVIGLSAVSTGGVTDEDAVPLRFSLFLFLFIGVYCLMIACSSILFQRYYIVLQPLIAVNIAINAWGVSRLVNNAANTSFNRLVNRATVGAVAGGLAAVCLMMKVPTLKGHADELRVPYRGQLDYVIPYIQQRYQKTNDLVIATNYEGTSYMFYLNAHIIDINQLNMKYHSQQVPDVISYRRSWGNRGLKLFKLLSQAHYEKILIPVADEQVNNCPEIDGLATHYFVSRKPQRPDEQAAIYCKTGELERSGKTPGGHPAPRPNASGR